MYFDGAHNSAGITKAINTLFSDYPEENKRRLIILLGFSQISNVDASFEAIFMHDKYETIKDIVLIESDLADIEFINFLPTCLKTSTLIQRLKHAHSK